MNDKENTFARNGNEFANAYKKQLMQANATT